MDSADAHRDFMLRAIKLSAERMRQNAGGPFGAVIVKDGRIIAEGWNEVTSTNDPTAHAEVGAIRAACAKLGAFSLAGCDIYTSCEPCPMCLAAIYWARPERVYFAATKQDAAAAGFDDAMIYEEFAKPYDQRRLPVKQVAREEALKAFAAWKKAANKIMCRNSKP